MKRCIGIGVIALMIAACKAPLRPDLHPSTPQPIAQLAAAVAADAARSGRETDPKVREELAADAARHADACVAQAPGAAPCLYYHAVALGLQARAHPVRAGEFLKAMLEALDGAEMADAKIDDAGPARVRALVLIRAPGWPLGPGDAEAGLAAARQAVALRPQYPPNWLAQAEALAKTGTPGDARQSYERARQLAQALPPTADRDDWLREAERGLQHP